MSKTIRSLSGFVETLNANPFGSICLIILAILAVAGLFYYANEASEKEIKK